MSVTVLASRTRAFLRKPLAATKFLNSSVPMSVMGFEDVGHQSRKLSDVSACTPPGATSWMGRINKFLLNEVYGAVVVNMTADVLVRCIAHFLPLLLSLCWYRKARSKNEKLTAELVKQISDHAMEECHKARSALEAVLNAGTQAAQASTSGHGILISSSGHAQSSGDGNISVSSASTSKAVKRIPKNGYPESSVLASVEPCDAQSISGILQAAPETSSLIADHASTYVPSAEQVYERARKPDIRKRVNHFIKHLQANKEHFKVDGEETVTASTSLNSGDSHILDIDIPIQAVLPGEVPSPTSLTHGDEVKRFLMELGIKAFDEMYSSRILQARVATTKRNLELLRDLAAEGMKVDKGFTLQIGEYYLYHCTGDPKNPVLLSLGGVEVPTILQAEYVAGVLTVRGRFLEGAELRAATSEEYLILHPEKQEHTYPNGIEEWRCYSPILLSDKPIHIFASKEVCVNKQYLIVRSEAFPMVDNTLVTVMREWVPATILAIFMLYNFYFISLEVSSFIAPLPLQQLWLPYVGVALVMGILHTLPDRMEIVIGRTLYHINLAYLTLRLAPQAYSSWKRKQVASQGTTVNDHFKKIGGTYKKIKQKDATKPNQENEEENIDVDRLDWQWPKFGETSSGIPYSLEDGSELQHNQQECFQPFEVICRTERYRKHDNSVFTNLPKRIVIRVFSKSLRNILRDLLPKCLQDFESYAEIQAEHLFSLYQQDVLQGVLTSIDSRQPQTAQMHEPSVPWLHMYHLIRFVEEEYGNIILQHQRMVTAGVISWDMLWTLITINEKVVFYCDISNEELCGKVLSWRYPEKADRYGRADIDAGSFKIDMEIWDYDCVSYRPHKIKRRIREFFQESLILNLEVRPIKFETNVQDKEAFFLERGKRYHELVLQSERRYLQYKGFMFWAKKSSPSYQPSEKAPSHCRESADGNVMIDQGAFSKMKSKRYMGTAQPATGWSQSSWGLDKKNFPSESDENLQFCPAVVYGFSFSSRKWGCFLVSRLREITFNPTVFGTLVMAEENSKEMLLAMTKYYLKKPVGDTETSIKEVEVDLVPNKGKGCIILLHGPPGTGKTFTVEALAETMECPLWQLTVSTCDKKPKALETKLVKKFEVAALWGAILLLDEADVYLSSRKFSPLAADARQGNALIGVFLRVLEYYQGILFLTTNEPQSFEQAIDSRISLSIQYKQFDIAQRRHLWRTFIERVGLANPSRTFWNEILGVQLNGRVIRNIVSTATMYSISQGVELNEGHILFAFRVRVPTLRDVVFEEEKPESRDGGAESMSAVLSYVSHDMSAVPSYLSHDDDFNTR